MTNGLWCPSFSEIYRQIIIMMKIYLYCWRYITISGCCWNRTMMDDSQPRVGIVITFFFANQIRVFVKGYSINSPLTRWLLVFDLMTRLSVLAVSFIDNILGNLFQGECAVCDSHHLRFISYFNETLLVLRPIRLEFLFCIF